MFRDNCGFHPHLETTQAYRLQNKLSKNVYIPKRMCGELWSEISVFSGSHFIRFIGIGQRCSDTGHKKG